LAPKEAIIATGMEGIIIVSTEEKEGAGVAPEGIDDNNKNRIKVTTVFILS
jgi:hypothetical protein